MLNEHSKCHGIARQHGKVNYLESAERRAEFSPEQLLSRIPLKKTDNILDFGAGTGYITMAASRCVEGTVYALDIDPSMLEIISLKAADEQLTNIVTILSGSAELPVAEASIDIIIASLVLHEINPLHEALSGIHKVLKQDGYLVVVELEPKEHSTHKAPRVSMNGMEQELADIGLRITEKFFPAESLYVLVAQKNKAE